MIESAVIDLSPYVTDVLIKAGLQLLIRKVVAP
jgi:hypothetical protein